MGACVVSNAKNKKEERKQMSNESSDTLDQ